MKKARMLRLAAPVAALVALGVVVSGGPATASSAKAGDVTLITMEKEGKELFFVGPETVAPGQVLRVKNLTDPRKVGPHTFSLVQRSTFPRSNDEIKACAKEFKRICGAIVKWHQVDLQTGETGRNPVEASGKGWDQQGNLKHRGDSWVSEREDEGFKQKVTAEAGKTLHFFCAVHPEMQGKIRVEE